MGDSSSEEEYPPWLQVVLDEQADYWDEVVVLQPADQEGSDKEWVEVKLIEVPDTQEAAAGKGPGQCRTYRVGRYSIIFIASEPQTPPYIGLVDKVFRRRSAQRLRVQDGKSVYRLGDFGVHAYWFYRPSEVPDAAWDNAKAAAKRLQQYTQGSAQYKLPGRKVQLVEQLSERQLLFSSHHTLHDYPDDKGILAMDGFLQACQVHWVGSSCDNLVRYEVHASTLVAGYEPGLMVRGFLWCAAKTEVQLDPEDKEVFKLDGKWPDKDTRHIVATMCERYKATADRLQSRNAAVLQRFHAAQAANQQTIPSDSDGDDGPGAADPQRAAAAAAGQARAAAAGGAQRQAVQARSPRLEGMNSPGLGGQAGDGGFDLLMEDDSLDS